MIQLSFLSLLKIPFGYFMMTPLLTWIYKQYVIFQSQVWFIQMASPLRTRYPGCIQQEHIFIEIFVLPAGRTEVLQKGIQRLHESLVIYLKSRDINETCKVI